MQASRDRVASVFNGSIKLVFTYDANLILAIKTIPGRKYWAPYNGPKYWTVPYTEKNVLIVKRLGFKGFDDDKIPNIAPDANVDIDFAKLKMELREYQKKDVIKIVNSWNTRALIGSEVGTGKTAVALASLYFTPQSLPCLVICPASLKYNWKNEIGMWLPDAYFSVKILDGFPSPYITDYYPKNNEITVINYDVLANRTNGQIGWSDIINFKYYRTLILDECHKIKNMKSARTKTITRFGKSFKHLLCLSGTPIESKPVEFYPVLHLVQKDIFPTFWGYAQTYCDAKMGPFGWDFNGVSNIDKLYEILSSSIMVRHLKSEILTELPPLQRIIVPVDINMSEYKRELDSLLEDYDKYNKNGIEVLAKIEKLRQAVIKAKLPIVYDWIDNYLESGRKLIVFCIHKETVSLLRKKYANKYVVVDGSVTGEKRQIAVDEFQNNPRIQLFIGNIQAAGEGITLTKAQDCLFIELDWTASAHEQAENRHHRIGQTADRVCAYYLIAQDTIESEIIKIIDKKASQFNKIVNGAEINPQMLLRNLYLDNKVKKAEKMSKEY